MRWGPLIAGGVTAGVLLAGFWELAEGLAGSPRLIAFDVSVATAVQSWRSPGLTVVMTALTHLGDTPSIALAAVVLFFALSASTRYLYASFAGGVVLAGGILSSVAKGSFARSRPPVEAALIDLPRSFSFPSGHTMGSLTLAFVMAYLVYRSGWRASVRVAVVGAWVLYAVLVALSRIYLGVHWPSDILASWLLGGALASLAVGVYETARVGVPKS